DAAVRSGLPAAWLEGAQRRAAARAAGQPLLLGSAPVLRPSRATIALAWVIDLFSPSRPVVAAACQARSVDGALQAARLYLAISAEEAVRNAAQFVLRVSDLLGQFPDANLLVERAAYLGDLAATVEGAGLPWADRLLDVTAAARRTWAFPGAADNARE